MDSSELLQGRPFGGCAILYRKSLAANILMLQSNDRRFCAIKFKKPSGSELLIICVYLPTDYGNALSRDEFLYTLGELDGFI